MDTRDRLALERLKVSYTKICDAINNAQSGNPYAAEIDKTRRIARMQTKTNITHQAASMLSEAVEMRAGAPEVLSGPEAIKGDTLDFLSVAFLERGAQVARSVGRVANFLGDPWGSGFLVGAGLFLTNNHVITHPHQAAGVVVEFDYERDLMGRPRAVTRYRLDPLVFLFDPDSGLDYTLLALGPRLDGPSTLDEFGYSGLSDAGDKHMIGEFANIIQHPQGRHKEVVLRENRLVNRLGNTLHYIADTERGSSGSPVYNSEWQVIALHHWGGAHLDKPPLDDPDLWDINEGIRISRIVKDIKSKLPTLGALERAKVERMLALGNASWRAEDGRSEPTPRPPAGPPTGLNAPQVTNDGRVTWTLPVQISVQLPIQTGDADVIAPAAVQAAPVGMTESLNDYSDRSGYDPSFLGTNIALPALCATMQADAAPLIDPAPGANPFELRYHHFSVLINKRRKLAFFTACNIDGATSKAIGRSSGDIQDLSADDQGLAEGDNWRSDPRIDPSHYSGLSAYEGQIVPGFASGFGRTLRMFQRGHLVRRIDPAWGDNNRAMAAEKDTFHWTNAAPQVGFFNMGRADFAIPGTAGGGLWRTAENFVLRNAVAEDQRVSSFTGPVFRDTDRAYRDIQIPAEFWKVTAWVEGGTLKSLALLVDQSAVFGAWPEGIGDARTSQTGQAEAFQDPAELARVRDFFSTVEEIETLTGLDFGEDMRRADIRAGAGAQLVDPVSIDDLFGQNPGALVADDLRQINGVGPTFDARLKALGIVSFQQVAAWTTADATVVGQRIGAGRSPVEQDWPGQAAALI
ncbi:MAG: DNA/RNA non-specific endonuclease [Pseudomonadota bacterium]